MAVKLRLRRMGKKRQPIYKVVAADVRASRDGKYIESIGIYDPKTDPSTISFKEDRALYWLGCGAQPTTTVKNLLSKTGLLLKRELIKKGLTEDEISSKMNDWLKLQELKIADKKSKIDMKKKELAEESAKKLQEKLAKKEEINSEAAEAKDTASENITEETK